MWKKRQIHPSPGASLRAFPSSAGRLWVCFRSQPQKWGVSKCSVLSGGCQRGKTPRQKFLAKGFKQSGSSDKPLRAAASRQNGALRNITIFSDVPPTHTHSSGGEGGRTGARRKPRGPLRRMGLSVPPHLHFFLIVLCFSYEKEFCPRRIWVN